jgi:hypothetical protein
MQKLASSKLAPNRNSNNLSLTRPCFSCTETNFDVFLLHQALCLTTVFSAIQALRSKFAVWLVTTRKVRDSTTKRLCLVVLMLH